MGISVTAPLEVFFSNREGKYFSSQFIHVPDSPVLNVDYVSDIVVKEILTSVREERFPEAESVIEHPNKALLVFALSRKEEKSKINFGTKER